MQNTSTGLLHELAGLSQEDKDRAIPNRKHQGPIFTVGEIVKVKEGLFRVHAITDKRLYLEGVPSAPTP